MASRAPGSCRTAIVLMALAGTTFAGQQHTLPTRQFQVRNPVAGGDATKRKAVFSAEEQLSPSLIVGDPTVSGATLRVALGAGSDQCFDLPASAWIPIGTVGFKYHDLAGPGAVVSATIEKEQFSGDLILKWKLRGTAGPIDLLTVAGNPGFAVDFQIVDGDEYCAGGATPEGSRSTDVVYRVTNVPAPAACGVSACAPH